MGVRKRWSQFACRDADGDVDRLHAPLVHIDVRVLVESDDHVRCGRHGCGDVGVRVQRHDDGNCGADGGPNGGDGVALGVLDPGDDHRSVQIQEDGVATSDGHQAPEQRALDVVVGCGFHDTAGLRERGEYGRQVDRVRGCGVDEPAMDGACPAPRLDDRRARPELRARRPQHKVVQARGRGREGVCLVTELGG